MDGSVTATSVSVPISWLSRRGSSGEEAVTRLKELGARHESGPDFKPFALRDGNLVTGQNPASAEPLAKLVMEALAARVAA